MDLVRRGGNIKTGEIEKQTVQRNILENQDTFHKIDEKQIDGV